MQKKGEGGRQWKFCSAHAEDSVFIEEYAPVTCFENGCECSNTCLVEAAGQDILYCTTLWV